MLLLFRYQVTLVTWQGIRLPLRESLQGNWCLTHSTKAWGGGWASGLKEDSHLLPCPSCHSFSDVLTPFVGHSFRHSFAP